MLCQNLTIPSYGEIMNEISAYVINLKEENKRRENVKTELQKIDVEPHIIEAYNGHDINFPFYKYKDLSYRWWDRPRDFKPGAFACYLSHAKCWKAISNGDKPYGMILEDDIVVNAKPFNEFSLENSINYFDVIFINQKMNRWTRFINQSTNRWTRFINQRMNRWTRFARKRKKFIKVSPLLKQLVFDGTFKDRIPGPGTDGYIVSKKGAFKLLNMIQSRKICMGVDYAMVFNSLSMDDINSIMTISLDKLPRPLRIFLENEKKYLLSEGPIGLDSYIYTPAALVKVKDFSSSIKHEVFLCNDVFDKSSLMDS